MFDGKVRGNRAVSSAGNKKRESDKEAFLENTRRQREGRAIERKKVLAIVKLQSFVRRCFVRKHVSSKLKLEMDKKVSDINSLQSAFTSRGSHFNLPLDVLLPIFRAFLFTFEGDGVSTTADEVKLKRLTSVLRLFLDSLTVKASGQFNSLLQAINEMGTFSIGHRIWGYQVLELCRISVRVLQSYFLSEDSNDSYHNLSSNRDLLISAVECSFQVLQTVLNWQNEVAPSFVLLNATVVPSSVPDRMNVVNSDSISKAEERPRTLDSGPGDVELFLCCIARYTSHSSTAALRLAIMRNKKTSDDTSLIVKTTGLLLKLIQHSVRFVEIPKARFKVCQQYDTALCCVAANILTIPDLKSYDRELAPIMQSLGREGGDGWLRALRGVCGTYAETHSTDISVVDDRFLRRVHFLNNYCACALSLTVDGLISQDSLRMLVSTSRSNVQSSLTCGSSSSSSSSCGAESVSANTKAEVDVERGGSWIEYVCDTLQSTPLVMLLSRMQGLSPSDHYHPLAAGRDDRAVEEDNAMQVIDEDGDGDGLDESNDSEETKDGEHAFALAGGLKRLEYRLSAALRGLREREVAAFRALKGRGMGPGRGGKEGSGPVQGSRSVQNKARGTGEREMEGGGVLLHVALSSMESIVRVLTANHAVSVLTDAVSSSTGSILPLFSVVKVYSKILRSCPSSTDSPHTAVPLSVSILNAMAFSRPKDPLSKRLWGLLSSFESSVLAEAINRGGPTPSPTPTPESIALSSTFSTLPIGGVSSSGGGTGAGAGGGPSPFLPSTVQAAVRLGISPSMLCDGLLSCLYLLCCVLSHQLTATDDEEFFEQQSTGAGGLRKMLPLSEVKLLVPVLKIALYRLYWTHPGSDTYDRDPSMSSSPSTLFDLQTRIAVTRLFNQLYTRNERTAYLTESFWHIKGIPRLDAAAVSEVMTIMDQAEGGGRMDDHHQDSRSETLRHVRTLLSCIPQVVPFEQRVDVFQALLLIDKANFFQSDGGGGTLAAIGMGGSVQVKVQRDTIVQDAFLGLRQAGGRLKGRVQVEFIGEAGIDGGGLFKEFLDYFLKAAFDPSLGLFCPTSAQLLVPNPLSSQCAEAIAFATSEAEGLVSYTEDESGRLKRVGGFTHLNLFHFLGKMLGKALYESILVEPQFSSVFLNLLLGRSNQLDDLQHLDAPMHRSLMAMKHAAARGEDVSSWGLGFEIDRVRDGVIVTEELLIDGQPVAVTKSNMHAFIHRKANYKLNIETSEQSRAFLIGFREMIPVDWMRMFSAKELQLLISGDQRPIDIADMRRHINYSGGYHDSQPYIQSFWDVVASMTAEEQGQLLHFVTSCPRQPLKGFGQLNPLICVQKVSPYSYSTNGLPGSRAVLETQGPGASAARLPSAATCMNLLKLPQYDSVQQLREKLLYAIKSHSGFELS